MPSCCCAGLTDLASLVRGKRLRKEHEPVADKPKAAFLLTSSKKKSVEEEYTVYAETLGEGGFGRVWKISSKISGDSCVVKSMVKEQIANVALFVNEISLQSECDHPHIARLYETFEDTEMVHIIMESCEGGELLDIIDCHGPLIQLDAWHIFRQLIDALCYLHSKVFIVHRDLKPENMLIKESDSPLHEATMKLIDFGFAQRFRPGEKTLKSCCGTPYYMCPEIFVDDPYNEKCDMWSAGVILYLLLSGDLPFNGECTRAILARVREGRLAFSHHVWDNVDPSAKELIQELCAKDPDVRPSAVEVLDKTWMVLHKEMVQASTQTAPTITSDLKHFSEMNLDDFKQLALGTISRLLGVKEIETIGDAFESEDVEDGTGAKQVSHSMFLSCNAYRQQHQDYSACWDAFRIFDEDGDGQITLEEFRKVLSLPQVTQSLKLNEAEASSVFLEVVKNSAGTVTCDEFSAALEAKGR